MICGNAFALENHFSPFTTWVYKNNDEYFEKIKSDAIDIDFGNGEISNSNFSNIQNHLNFQSARFHRKYIYSQNKFCFQNILSCQIKRVRERHISNKYSCKSLWPTEHFEILCIYIFSKFSGFLLPLPFLWH